ncbi:Probable serine threonine- kinase kinX, putative [Babesia ovata]|uniref:Probable serine threonine-kinase kinX, putative n=1 Tax=Babesia ovata TaxID=189622 RepID=A0A2H6K7I0_9APIC|nr:Probable serine threonine- kinase kinX, putative [Babesia ovata]GBE58909.1 Probable serine threonine- kinase kinX, putative [Babesia ovata]
MKASVGTVFRVLLFVFFSIALHVQANGRSWSTEKARKNSSGKNGKNKSPAVDYGVNMEPINRPKTMRFRKPPSTYSGLGSNNFYYPGQPTLANLGASIPL